MNGRAVALSVIAALLVAAGGTYLLFAPKDRPVSEGGWYVEVAGAVSSPRRWTLEELRRNFDVEVTAALKGTGEDGLAHRYTGAPLFELVTLSAPSPNATKAAVVAVDHYSHALPLGTLREHPSIILAFAKDGEPLGTKAAGGSGPVRLIVPQEVAGEYNAQYCVKYVYRIEVG